MFGRKKLYKKGLADAMQAYEDFGKKQEAALEHIREEVRNGNKTLSDALSGLGDELNGIYRYLNSKEKETLYHLSTPMDIKELDAEEQILLLAVLYQLADDQGADITGNQRAYIRSVQKYLEITNPQTFADFSTIENIDSVDVQKTFLRIALEFFYLQDGDELSDTQEEFFDNFSVNKKQAAIIENEVSRLYNAVGPEGIAEKYGYVPEPDDVLPENEPQQGETPCGMPLPQTMSSAVKNLDEISEKAFRAFTDEAGAHICIETENYIMYLDREVGWESQTLNKCLFDKRTGIETVTPWKTYGEQEKLPQARGWGKEYDSIEEADAKKEDYLHGNTDLLDFLTEGHVTAIDGDNVFYTIFLKWQYGETEYALVFLYDIITDERKFVFEYEVCRYSEARRLAAGNGYYVFDDAKKGYCLFNLNTGEKKHVRVNGEGVHSMAGEGTITPCLSICNGYLYFGQCFGGSISALNLETMKVSSVREGPYSFPKLVKGYRDKVYFAQYDNMAVKSLKAEGNSNEETILFKLSSGRLHCREYRDGILVATTETDFPLYFIDAMTGNKVKIGENCGYWSSSGGGLFRKASYESNLNDFLRIGNTVYYWSGRASEGVCKVSLNNPMEVEKLSPLDEQGRKIESWPYSLYYHGTEAAFL